MAFRRIGDKIFVHIDTFDAKTLENFSSFIE